MQTWFERLFDVPAAEQRKALLVLAYIFCAASACVVGRTAADTLFLARIGSEQLAWMYLVSALVVAVAAMLYARLARWTSLHALIAATHLALAAASVALRWLLPDFHHNAYVIAPIYLLSETQGAMAAILFATVLNETFQGGGSRGVFGIAGLGSTLAGIVFGGLVALQSAQLHAENLLYVMAVLHLLTLACVAPLHRSDAVEPSNDVPPAGAPLPDEVFTETEGFATTDSFAERSEDGADVETAEVAEIPAPPGYEKWLVALAVVQFPAILLVGYQWKVAVNDAYHHSEDAMAAYFGGYYAIVNLLTAFLQITLAGRVLKRFDLLPGLLAFPIALLLTATTIVVSSSSRVLLWATTLSKGSEALRRSFSDPAFQLLYSPLPQAARRQIIARIGGMVKPLAEAFAVLAILEVTFLSGEHDISYVVAALTLLWLWLARQCQRRYVEASAVDEPASQPGDGR